LRLPDPPLLLITDRRQAARPLVEVVAGALEGGCRWISLREKDLPPAEQIALARSLAALARPVGATLMLHGDPALAREAGLAGVHLPGRADVGRARAALGRNMWLSVSAHDLDEALAAAAGGADAVTLSPIFASESKPGYGPALGLERLAEVAAVSPVPIIALGGIGPHNAAACLAAGAAAVAVMGEVMRAIDPAATTAALIAALAPSSSPCLEPEPMAHPETDPIVVALELSDADRPVLEVAQRFGKALGAEVHLVHVTPEEAAFVGLPREGEAAPADLAPPAAGGVGYAYDRQLRADQMREARSRLEAARDNLAAAGVEASAHLIEGLPAAAIVEAAERRRAGLIVVGARRRSAVGEWLFGSTAREVTGRASCPVLLVPLPD
jgi:thiamine-phosphate pyrophosphorylase